MESTVGREGEATRLGGGEKPDSTAGQADTYYLEVISAVVGFQNESVCSGRVVSQTVMKAR